MGRMMIPLHLHEARSRVFRDRVLRIRSLPLLRTLCRKSTPRELMKIQKSFCSICDLDWSKAQ